MEEKQGKERAWKAWSFSFSANSSGHPTQLGWWERAMGMRGRGKRKEGEREMLHIYPFPFLCEKLNQQFWEGQQIVQSHRELEAGTGFCPLRAIQGFQVPLDKPSPHSSDCTWLDNHLISEFRNVTGIPEGNWSRPHNPIPTLQSWKRRQRQHQACSSDDARSLSSHSRDIHNLVSQAE